MSKSMIEDKYQLAALVEETLALRNSVSDINSLFDAQRDNYSIPINSTTVMTKLFTGQKIFVDTNDISEAPNLIFDGYWERDITTAFMKIINEGDVVFDLGSTFGYFGLIASSISFKKPGAQTHYFDPNPAYARPLKHSLMINGVVEGSFINTVALAEKKGRLKSIMFKDDWNSNTLLDIKSFQNNRTLFDDYDVTSVDVITLDDYCKKNDVKEIDVMKMDIEGFEEKALEGAKNIIGSSTRLKLLLEFTPGSYKSPDKFFSSLRSTFGHVYVIDSAGNYNSVSSYEAVMQNLRDNRWCMLIASKVAL